MNINVNFRKEVLDARGLSDFDKQLIQVALNNHQIQGVVTVMTSSDFAFSESGSEATIKAGFGSGGRKTLHDVELSHVIVSRDGLRLVGFLKRDAEYPRDKLRRQADRWILVKRTKPGAR